MCAAKRPIIPARTFTKDQYFASLTDSLTVGRRRNQHFHTSNRCGISMCVQHRTSRKQVRESECRTLSFCPGLSSKNMIFTTSLVRRRKITHQLLQFRSTFRSLRKVFAVAKIFKNMSIMKNHNHYGIITILIKIYCCFSKPVLFSCMNRRCFSPLLRTVWSQMYSNVAVMECWSGVWSEGKLEVVNGAFVDDLLRSFYCLVWHSATQPCGRRMRRVP